MHIEASENESPTEMLDVGTDMDKAASDPVSITNMIDIDLDGDDAKETGLARALFDSHIVIRNV